MSVHETAPKVTGMSCDATACSAELKLPEPVSVYERRDALREAGGTLGWSLWVSRSTRTYCPNHGPRPGSKLRRVW